MEQLEIMEGILNAYPYPIFLWITIMSFGF